MTMNFEVARWRAALPLALLVLAPKSSFAFGHLVKPGESLAQIAGQLYGDPRLEFVLVEANALDAQGGTVIVPGMRLEVPAPTHHAVVSGETWAGLALLFLGTNEGARAELLARVNKGVSWVPPTQGQEIEIPAVVSYIAGDGETTSSIAGRFWADPNRGWQLNAYNGREATNVKRGEVILVPMPELKLTPAGKAEARSSAEREGASADATLDRQRRADADLPQLLADIRYGRYAEALARGNRILGGGALTPPQLAIIYRALLEAYVAIDARGPAAAACAAWRLNDPGAVLDPVRLSPKILAACEHH